MTIFDLWARARAIVRVAEFDTRDASGRSKERYRRAFFASVASAAGRGIQVVISLVSIPLTLNYLGSELYGIWLVITSVVGMFVFADLGIGNGLLSALSDAYGRNDKNAAEQCVSSAFFMLAAVGAAVAAMFFLSYDYVPWAKIFNAQSAQATPQVGPAVSVLVTCFCINLPLSVISRVRNGYQDGFIDGAFSIIGSILTLGALVLVINFNGDLAWLAVGLFGVPIVALLMNGAELWGRSFRWLRPSITRVSRKTASALMRIGVLFFVLQVSSIVAYQSDAIIIAHVLGAAAVTQYAVPMKLFLLIPAVLGFIVAPLWPAYSEAMARGDTGWVRVTLLRSINLSLAISVPCALVLILLGPKMLNLWVGPSVIPTLALLLAAGIWAILASVGAAIAAFLNGVHLLKFQAVNALVMMVANVGISIYLTDRVGISGVVWGSVIAQVVFMYIPLVFYMRRVLRQMEDRSQA